eukprot:TRINITY_DN211_c0_g1_i1.p1 TRINITY_DN211_c0_g1~~TRINITY_DN211_c0_g1_i1.p1  ORF type:complete len:185 (-),score=26.81 TRINITY_DN211_c0_g1_i1:468-1022(-)
MALRLAPVRNALFSASRACLAVHVGEKVPSADLTLVKGPGQVEKVRSDDLFGKGTTVLFSVPGAFTPTCSQKHLPGFVEQAPSLKAKGVDRIVCLAVNDPFVVSAWGEQADAFSAVQFLADGAAKFTKDLGLDWDLSEKGLGIRGKRFMMIVKDGKITSLDVEPEGALTVSGADQCAMRLGAAK